jgi:hypothetical protein
MGGLCSGRSGGKRTTNQLTSVNIKTVGAVDRLHGSVKYRYTLAGKYIEHTAWLTQTDCNYGGVRYWYRCGYCDRSVSDLYFSNGECACRHCFKLAYKSERETWSGQQFRKANKIRELLGWEPGIAFADGGKPKGMHWKTFYRMKSEHDFRVQKIIGHTMQWVAKIQAGQRVSL